MPTSIFLLLCLPEGFAPAPEKQQVSLGETCAGLDAPSPARVGVQGRRGRGLAHWCPAAPPPGRRQPHGPSRPSPPLPRPPLPAAASASAPRTRSPRRRRCRTCHHVATAGSCLTLSGPRFLISRCPPSLVAVCSAAPRGRPPIPPPNPDPALPHPSRPSRRYCRAGPGTLHPVQLRQRCPRCAFLPGMGLNGEHGGVEAGGTLERIAGAWGGGRCSGSGDAVPLSAGAVGSGSSEGVREEGEGGGLAPSEQ